MDNFLFDPALHKYFLNGLEIPGVTTALKNCGLINTDFYTEEARDRGSRVHECIYLDLVGGLVLDEVEPEIRPYVDSWLALREALKPEPMLEYCERPMYHPSLFYGGTMDFVGTMNGRRVLIDTKSGCVKGWAGYQTAAYEELLVQSGVKIEARFGLKLDPSIKKGPPFKLIPLNDPSDRVIFVSALNIFYAKEASNKTLN